MLAKAACQKYSLKNCDLHIHCKHMAASTKSTRLLLSNGLIGVTQINIPLRHSVGSVLTQCVLLLSKDDQSIFEFQKKQLCYLLFQSHCMQGTDTYCSTAELFLRFYYSIILLALLRDSIVYR